MDGRSTSTKESIHQFSVDFVGVGAAKAGTTWLAHCLGEHPQVCASDPKELNCFCTRIISPKIASNLTGGERGLLGDITVISGVARLNVFTLLALRHKSVPGGLGRSKRRAAEAIQAGRFAGDQAVEPTTDDLVSTGLPEEKMTVIPIAAGHKLKTVRDRQEINEISRKYGIAVDVGYLL
jgi:hypothetical protein